MAWISSRMALQWLEYLDRPRGMGGDQLGSQKNAQHQSSGPGFQILKVKQDREVLKCNRIDWSLAGQTGFLSSPYTTWKNVCHHIQHHPTSSNNTATELQGWIMLNQLQLSGFLLVLWPKKMYHSPRSVGFVKTGWHQVSVFRSLEASELWDCKDRLGR